MCELHSVGKRDDAGNRLLFHISVGLVVIRRQATQWAAPLLPKGFAEAWPMKRVTARQSCSVLTQRVEADGALLFRLCCCSWTATLPERQHQHDHRSRKATEENDRRKRQKKTTEENDRWHEHTTCTIRTTTRLRSS